MKLVFLAQIACKHFGNDSEQIHCEECVCVLTITGYTVENRSAYKELPIREF